MSLRRALILALAAGGIAPVAWSDSLDKAAKKWLEEVKPLMLSEEEKTFRSLKDKGDREEFQKIFWARRNPKGPGAPDNPFKAEYDAKRLEAEKRFVIAGRAATATDCGAVLLLLGEPAEVKKDPGAGVGPRPPETWTYKGERYAGGQMQLQFDGECQLPASAVSFRSQLQRVAESKLASPNIDYRRGKEGHIVKLADQLPKPSPAQTLLKEPRQDFQIATQAGFVKNYDGSTVLVGLVQGEAAAVTVAEEGGKKTAKVVVVAEAKGDETQPGSFSEQEISAEVGANGMFTASYRMILKPGHYTLAAGALDPKTQKGALASIPVDVPNLNVGDLSTSSLMMLRALEDVPETGGDPAHAYAAFVIGKNRLIPWFGSTLSAGDQPLFFYQFYDSKLDDATGKGTSSATITIQKDGKTVGAAEEKFDGKVGGSVIGPVPMSKGAGKYVVRLKVKDAIAQKEATQELPFEVK